jgi:hypothetical protein
MEVRTMKTIWALTLGVFLAVSGSSPGYAGPLAGDSEVLLSGGFFHQQDSDTGNFNIDLSYGY